ncbi:auxin-induced protein 22D [Daucus carota subsp. sativus]|uniref:auxin-induced protein 22D n=1 Tax=Daucus carota subsp. sativus TaxID=79200 RepID=UPI0007B274C1|nr:PREDICTED: auxin-induced protein 22D-like [Daucus carota subsp. sativus]
MEMDKQMIQENDDLHLNLRLGLPGSDDTAKKTSGTKRASSDHQDTSPPPTKTQVIGWPPVRSYRKNILQQKQEEGAMYVKVSMDGAPFLRKIDLKVYNNYPELLEALQNMFKCSIGVYSEREGYNGSEHAPTYEDKDGDLMLAGDVPWEMFVTSCKRMRIMKASEAKGL